VIRRFSSDSDSRKKNRHARDGYKDSCQFYAIQDIAAPTPLLGQYILRASLGMQLAGRRRTDTAAGSSLPSILRAGPGEIAGVGGASDLLREGVSPVLRPCSNSRDSLLALGPPRRCGSVSGCEADGPGFMPVPRMRRHAPRYSVHAPANQAVNRNGLAPEFTACRGRCGEPPHRLRNPRFHRLQRRLLHLVHARPPRR